MKILFAASEAAPFAKTGGLADVAGSLPAVLAQQGHQVHVILPLYEAISDEWRAQMTFLKHFDVPLAWRRSYCGVFELEHQGVTYWFLDNEYYFKRPTLYGHYDDGERFAFFSRAIVETPGQLNWIPDVIHCNDWQTALVPVYLLDAARIAPSLAQTKSVFTIHNIEYQGRYNYEMLEDVFGLDAGYFHEKLLAYHGGINLMKGAIYAANFVTTVSPTYAWQLREPFYAHGLDGVISDNRDKVRGILNGVDTQLYDPRHNSALAQSYSPTRLQGKRVCKATLQQMVGLNEAPDVPIIACISRLVPHKGFDLVLEVLHEMMELNIQMVVLGTGEWKYEQAFQQFEGQYSGRFSARILYSAQLSDAIYAGADIFLMPSISEPCGLSQIIAMRYGTIPVVRETGGLKDTVIPVSLSPDEGTGFTFSDINAHDMLWTLSKAAQLYSQDQPAWKRMMKRAMTADFSWNQSASEYIEIYRQITGGAQ